MIAYKVWKHLHALEHRAFLLFEVTRLKNLGVYFPRGLLPDIIRRPHEAEDFVHIKAFSNIPTQKFLLIDVGANVGEFATDFLRYLPGSSCVTFEPDPRNIDALNKRFAKAQNVKIFDFALSESDGKTTFNLSEDTKYSSVESYNKIEDSFRRDNASKTIEVQVRRFDTIDVCLGDTFNILKIDVQGHELKCLKGFGNRLSEFNLCLIEVALAEEYVGLAPSFPEIVTILADHDLFPIVFQRFGRAHNSYGYERDVLFARRHLLQNAYWPHSNEK